VSTAVRAQPVPAAAHRARRTRDLLLPAAWSGFPLAGLLLVAAYSAAYRGGGHVHLLLWAGVVTALATAGTVLVLSRRRAGAAAALVVALVVLLSLPKFLRAPSYFNFYDELAHLRAAQALLGGEPLFGANALNRIVPDYPGLHALTAALSAATGGSVFEAGNLVVLIARVVGGLAVLLLARRVVALGRAGLLRRDGEPAALLAAVVFLANPAFMYFDAQYSYQSLAFPLVCVVLLLALRLGDFEGGAAAFVAAVPLALAVVVIHHGSSYLLAGLLLLTVLVAYATRRPPSAYLLALTGVTIVAAAGWLFGAARYTLTYVGPFVSSYLRSVPEFLTGSTRPRQLFGGFLPVPVAERVTSYAAVIVLCGLFGYGGWRLLRRGGESEDSDRVAAWVLAALGLTYFASLPLVALRGDQVAKRVWEFGFVGLAPACGAALCVLAARRGLAGKWVAGVLVGVVFVGSGVARSGEHIRFPGPYRPSADPRAMTPDVVAAARWLRAAYGPDHRVVGDRTLAAVLGSYGEQTPVTYQEDGRPVWKVFQPETLTPEALAEIRDSDTGWIAVDRRAADSFPLTGFYFDESEPGAYVDTRLTAAALAKFDTGGFRRAYDNGHVVLYRVEALP